MWLFCGGIFQTAMLSLFKLVVFCIFCISIQILKFEFMKLIPITREIVPSWTCTGYLYHTFQPVSQDFHSQLYLIFWFVLVLPLCCSVLSPFTLGHFICTFLQVSATEHGIEHSISLLLLLLFFFPIASLPWSTIFPIFPPSYSVCATSHNGSRTGLHVYSLLIFFFSQPKLCVAALDFSSLGSQLPSGLRFSSDTCPFLARCSPPCPFSVAELVSSAPPSPVVVSTTAGASSWGPSAHILQLTVCLLLLPPNKDVQIGG